MAKNNPECTGYSAHHTPNEVDKRPLRKLQKALSAIVMGVLLALSADVETAQGQDVATYSEGKCRLAYYDSVNAVYVTVAIAENVTQPDCNLSSKFTRIDQISGYSQDQPTQQPAVEVAPEAVIITTNQGESQASAQRVEAVAPQAVYVVPQEAQQPSTQTGSIGTLAEEFGKLFDPDAWAGVRSETSQPLVPQVENQQPSKAYVETAQKLGRVEVVEGQGLVKLFIALSTCLSGLFYPAAAGLIFVVAYKLAGQMWRNSKG